MFMSLPLRILSAESCCAATSRRTDVCALTNVQGFDLMKSDIVASAGPTAAGPVSVPQGAVRPAARAWLTRATSTEPLSVPQQQQQQQHAQQRSHRLVERRLPKAGTAPSPSSVSDEAEASTAVLHLRQRAAAALGLPSVESVQDFLASLVLSECVYKRVELEPGALADVLSSFVQSFFPLLELEGLQLCRSDVTQHHMVAESPDAIYVAFMGTKQARDLVTDASVLHEPVWAEAVALAADQKSIPTAHTGFLQRARAVNVEHLHEVAKSKGKRLVLCGHSLGGAVAKLCTLRLLRELPEWPPARLRCICFATPAVGNTSLAEMVESAGWAPFFSTYFLPEDQLLRLMSFTQFKPSTSSPADAVARVEALAGAMSAASPVQGGEGTGAAAGGSNGNTGTVTQMQPAQSLPALQAPVPAQASQTQLPATTPLQRAGSGVPEPPLVAWARATVASVRDAVAQAASKATFGSATGTGPAGQPVSREQSITEGGEADQLPLSALVHAVLHNADDAERLGPGALHQPNAQQQTTPTHTSALTTPFSMDLPAVHTPPRAAPAGSSPRSRSLDIRLPSFSSPDGKLSPPRDRLDPMDSIGSSVSLSSVSGSSPLPGASPLLSSTPRSASALSLPSLEHASADALHDREAAAMEDILGPGSNQQDGHGSSSAPSSPQQQAAARRGGLSSFLPPWPVKPRQPLLKHDSVHGGREVQEADVNAAAARRIVTQAGQLAPRAAGTTDSTGHSSDQGAASEVATATSSSTQLPASPRRPPHAALSLALARKRARRQLQRLLPLPALPSLPFTVTRFAAFGAQLYLSPTGVVPVAAEAARAAEADADLKVELEAKQQQQQGGEGAAVIEAAADAAAAESAAVRQAGQPQPAATAPAGATIPGLNITLPNITLPGAAAGLASAVLPLFGRKAPPADPSEVAKAALAASAAATAATAFEPRGPFSHHRMVAHRHRVLQLLHLAGALGPLPAAAAPASQIALGTVSASAVQKQAKGAASSAPPATTQDALATPLATQSMPTPGSSATTAYRTIQLKDDIVPAMAIERAAATLPLLPPPPVRQPVVGNRESTPEVHDSAASRPSSKKDIIKDPVTLTVQVEGQHLQHARSCTGYIHGISAPLSVRLIHTQPHQPHLGLLQVQTPTQGPHGNQSPARPLAGALQSFARLLGRQAPGAASRHGKAEEGVGHCTVIAEVTLPRAALDTLSSAAHEHLQARYERQQKAAAAAAAQRGQVLWRRAQQLRSGRGGGGLQRGRPPAVVLPAADGAGTSSSQAGQGTLSTAGKQQQSQSRGSADSAADVPRVWLELRFVSDFSEARTPVSLEPRRAALIGSSPGAAALLQAALASQASRASNIVPAPAQWLARGRSTGAPGNSSTIPGVTVAQPTQLRPVQATGIQAAPGPVAAAPQQLAQPQQPSGWRVLQAGSSLRQLAGNMLNRNASQHIEPPQSLNPPPPVQDMRSPSSPATRDGTSMFTSGSRDSWDVQQGGALAGVRSSPPALALPAVAAAAAAAAASGALTADPIHTAGATATAAALAAALVSGAGGASAQGSTASALPVGSSPGVALPQVLEAPSPVAGDDEKPLKPLQAPALVDGPPDLPQAATSPATSPTSTPRIAPRTSSWTVWRSPFHHPNQQQLSQQLPAHADTNEQPSQGTSIAAGAVTGVAARLASAGSQGLATAAEAVAVPALVAAGAVLPSRQWRMWRPWQQQQASPDSLASFAIDRLDSATSIRSSLSSSTEVPLPPLASAERNNSTPAAQVVQGPDSKQAAQPGPASMPAADVFRAAGGLRPLAAVRNQLSMLLSLAQQQWQATHAGQPKASLPPSILLDSGLVLTNVQQLSPATSPFVLLRALAAVFRRQAMMQTGWWRWVLTGLSHAVRPTSVYNFVRGLPFMWRQAMHSDSTGGGLGQMWNALVVAASALDPPSLLTGRDFSILVDRASRAGVPLLPVVLTSPSLPAARTSAAVVALAKACHTPVAAVRVVSVSEEALRNPSSAVAQQAAQLGLQLAGQEQGQQQGVAAGSARIGDVSATGGRATGAPQRQVSRLGASPTTLRWRPTFPQVVGASLNSKNRASSSSSNIPSFWSWGNAAAAADADASASSRPTVPSLASEASLRELRASLYKLLQSSSSSTTTSSTAELSAQDTAGLRPVATQPVSKL